MGTPRSRPAFGSTDAQLLLMAVIWGVNFSVVKYGTQQLEPLAFNGVRVLIATAVLTGLAVARSAPWPCLLYTSPSPRDS